MVGRFGGKEKFMDEFFCGWVVLSDGEVWCCDCGRVGGGIW